VGGCWIWPKPEQALRVKWEDRNSQEHPSLPGVRFPLRKGGSAERRWGCLTRPEGQGNGVVLVKIRCAKVRFSTVCKTTPRRLRDTVATPLPL
jgi:hypothetical protein